MDKSLLPHSQSKPKADLKSDLKSEQSMKQLIRSLNLKVTPQRMQILQCLRKGRAHVTAQELFEAVQEVDASVGFATVYRFLRDLTGAGVVTELRMGGSSARYELAPQEHHDHLTCVRCGKICEFENHEIELLQEKVALQFGFELKSHVLELYGICRDCQNTNSQS